MNRNLGMCPRYVQIGIEPTVFFAGCCFNQMSPLARARNFWFALVEQCVFCHFNSQTTATEPKKVEEKFFPSSTIVSLSYMNNLNYSSCFLEDEGLPALTLCLTSLTLRHLLVLHYNSLLYYIGSFARTSWLFTFCFSPLPNGYM